MNAVQQQNKIFKAVITQSPSAVVISDDHGVIEYANEAFTTILGYSPEEVKKDYIKPLLYDEEAIATYNNMRNALGKGKAWRGDVRLIRKDQQPVWIRMMVFTVSQEHGSKNFVTIINDVTELLASENTMREQQAIYKTLVDNIPLAIVIFDENGKVRFANELTETSLHLEKGSMAGMTVRQAYPREISDDQLRLIRKVFKSGKPVNFDRHAFIDGQMRHFKVTRQPLFNADRKVTGVMAIAQDFTEQTRLDQMLKIQYKIDSLSNITTDLKSSLDIVFRHLMQIEWADCGGLYLANRDKEILELVYHTGISDEFVKNTSVYSFDSGNAKVAFGKIPRYVTADVYQSSSGEDIRKEKITFIVALPLVFENKVIGLLNLASRTVRDLEEYDRQAIESIAMKIANLIELILTREELNRSNDELVARLNEINVKQQMLIQKSRLESLGELSAGLAHEINQPLSVVSLAMENLRYKIEKQAVSEEYMLGKIEIINQSINKIRTLIDHVRIFSRDQETIMLERVDVNQVITNALSMINSQLKHHHIKVITELSDDIGHTIGNPSRFEQVILNLLSNAKDALVEKDKKSMANRPGEIRITSLPEDDRIIIRVRDNGTGISIENLDKIFNPFYTTKIEGKGTGLGLPIVYGIVREMKGEISVRSDLGVFTEIIISLPRYKK